MQQEDYGIDWDGPIPTDDLHDSDEILVPEIFAPTNFQVVQDINPLAESEFRGMDIYSQVLECINST